MNIPFLAFTKKDEFKNKLSQELSLLTGHKPLVYSEIEELWSFIKPFPKLHFLLVDISGEDSRTVEFKKLLIRSHKKFDHLIFIDSSSTQNDQYKSFAIHDEIGLFNYLKEILLEINFSAQNWVSSPVFLLKHFQKLPCDIFIKISDKKYVKRLNQNDSIDFDLIENFKKRGIHQVFFLKEVQNDFFRHLINQLLTQVTGKFEDDLQKLKAKCDIFETTKELIHSLHLNPQIVYVCQNLIQDIHQEIFLLENEFSSYLRTLRENDQFSFHFRFIELTSYLASHLLVALEVKDYSEKLKNLITAAYFSDITLSEPEFIHHIEREFQQSFTEQNNVEVLTHAWKSAKMVLNNSIMNSDVAILIKEHHGSVDGFGFPSFKNTHRLNNLSKCLIIAQEMAYRVLVNPQLSFLEVIEITMKNHDELVGKRLITLFKTLLDSSEDVKAS
jgi:hypothetical protein